MTLKAALKSWAWRTPLGGTSDAVMDRLMAGNCAAMPNPHADACPLVATICKPPVPARHQRYLRRMGLYAVEVAVEAFEKSGLKNGQRLGLFFGYGGLRAHWADMMPAFEHQQSDGRNAWGQGLMLLHPFWMLQHLSNNAHAMAAQLLDARGEGNTYAGANAGAQAMAGAIRALAAGVVDVAVVVAYDSVLEPETLVELAKNKSLTKAVHPTQWVPPYVAHSCGFVPGEAAAALVFQRPESMGSTLAYVQSLDGADGEKNQAKVATVARLVKQLGQPGDAVDGVGWAKPQWDQLERQAVAQVVGRDAPLLCTTSAMGHLGAATAVVQTIGLTESLRVQRLPPLAGMPADSPWQHPLPPLRHSGQEWSLPLQPIWIKPQSTFCRSAIGLSVGSPGLAGVVRVELP
jgi:3-oxoacyl-[acyl-carrier-protein] synthase II